MGLQFFSPARTRELTSLAVELKGRSYFHKLIIEGIRRECGDDFVIIVRLDSVEGRAGGVEEVEAVAFARLVESFGADAINVSAGTYAAWDVIVPPPSYEQGWNWRICRRIKESVDIPVMLAGSLRDPVVIEQLIKYGDTDFVCLGRQSLRILSSRTSWKEEKSTTSYLVWCTQRCMSFNDHDSLQEGDWGISCIFNPMSNNRKDVQYGPTDNPKRLW